MLRPSPKFLVGAILVPQTQEFATVHANPGADPCARLIGSRGANVAPEAESHGRQKRPWRTSPWLACFVFVVCVCVEYAHKVLGYVEFLLSFWLNFL